MDLKPYYDKVLSLQAKTQGVMSKIESALSLSTAEGEEQALAMNDELVSALAEQDKAEGFYNTLLKASKAATNPVMNFLPVDQGDVEDEAPAKKALNLSEYQALHPRDRLAFAKAGGKIAS